MGKTLYVGNLPFSITENEVRRLFARHGAVHSVDLIHNADTGEFLGFAFVGMAPEAAAAAIEHLDDFEIGGRHLRVVTTDMLDLWAKRRARSTA